MLDDLQQQYLASLTAKIDELKTLGRALQHGSTEAESLVRTLAHSLHGSGATFGFPQITNAARATEQAPAAQLQQRIVDLVQVLQQVLSPSAGEASATTDILIIDDDPEFANALQAGFAARSPQFRVSHAATGSKAQELLVRRKYSLILLDLVLPDRDGRDLLKEIKQEFNLSTPVYVVSAIDRDLIRIECMALGADKFISKPIDVDALVTTIDKMLKKAIKRELTLVPLGQEQAPRESSGSVPPPAAAKVATQGKAIMVAEDDAMQANLVRQRLVKEGMVVDVVSNGEDAVKNMRDKPYAVFILDVNMPKLNGFEVLQRIRKDAVMNTTPVIMLTAMGSEADIIRAYDAGADDYILKPFSAIQLVARVKTLLKK